MHDIREKPEARAPLTAINERPLTPSYRTAGATALVIFALYLATLSPTIAFWDAGEYITAAAGLGIPHPPGNPGFVLIGRFMALLPIASTVALRLNVFVALASALSAGLWMLIAEHVARRWLAISRARAAGVACALIGATAFTVWNQSVVNEKVYTISLFLLVLDVWTALRWQQNPDGKSADRRLALICYRLGIGYTVHIAGLLAGTAVLTAVLTTRPQTFRRTRFLALCAALFGVGLTPFIALPIRAAFPLGINEGHPTACEEGVPRWSCTVSVETARRFLYAHNRTQYAKPSIRERQETLGNQTKMWWMYFKWQWFRDPQSHAPEQQSALAIVMILLAGIGAYAHHRYDRETFYPFAVLIGTLTVGLLIYLNFRLGYSQAVAMGVTNPLAREARDRDYFYLWSFSALAVWIGLGLAHLWKSAATFLAKPASADIDPWADVRRWRWEITSVVLALAVLPLILNWKSAPRRNQTFAEDFAVDMLNSVEPNAVLFTGGDNDSFPLWFAQQVLGIRRDVSIVLIPYLSTDWYVRELITRKAVAYDTAHGSQIYKGLKTDIVAGPLIGLTRERADAIPAATQTLLLQEVRMPGFTLNIPPTTLNRDVVVMLRIIQNAGRNRPIYFSGGAGSVAIDEYLKPHLVTQGLTRKLVPDVATIPGVIITKREGPIDAVRTSALWEQFRGPKGLLRNGVWIDEASAVMPYMYLRLAIAMAEASDSAGRGDAGKSLRMQAFNIAQELDFSRYLRSGRPMNASSGLGYAPVSAK